MGSIGIEKNTYNQVPTFINYVVIVNLGIGRVISWSSIGLREKICTLSQVVVEGDKLRDNARSLARVTGLVKAANEVKDTNREWLAHSGTTQIHYRQTTSTACFLEDFRQRSPCSV